jgi:hypothetical protein
MFRGRYVGLEDWLGCGLHVRIRFWQGWPPSAGLLRIYGIGHEGENPLILPGECLLPSAQQSRWRAWAQFRGRVPILPPDDWLPDCVTVALRRELIRFGPV